MSTSWNQIRGKETYAEAQERKAQQKAAKEAAKKAKNQQPIETTGLVVSSQKVKIDDYATVLRYITVLDGKVSKAYTEEELKEEERKAGSTLNWWISACKVYPDKTFEVGDPETTISMLKNRPDLIDKVYNLDQVKKTEPESAQQPPAPAGATDDGIDPLSLRAMELLADMVGLDDTFEDQMSEKKKKFLEGLGVKKLAKKMSGIDLANSLFDKFSQFERGQDVQEMLEEKTSTSTSAPAQASAPTPQPATGQNQTAGTRLVFHNRATGQYLDYLTCEVVPVGQDLGTKKLFEIGTGTPIKVVNPAQPGQPTPPSQPTPPPTQPNPTQPSQPTAGLAGSPVVGPQGGTAGSATDVPLEEVLKRPDLQQYLMQYGQECGYMAVQAERKRRKENKRQRNQQNNGPKGGQQQGGGNA